MYIDALCTVLGALMPAMCPQWLAPSLCRASVYGSHMNNEACHKHAACVRKAAQKSTPVSRAAPAQTRRSIAIEGQAAACARRVCDVKQHPPSNVTVMSPVHRMRLAQFVGAMVICTPAARLGSELAAHTTKRTH